MTQSYWRGKRVLLTGHTGFKGAWAATILAECGANVTGVSLAAETDPNLWLLIRNSIDIDDKVVDLRDATAIASVCQAVQPEIILHLAGQAQVPKGYEDPVGTFSSNVMGAINLLEAVRATAALETVLIVTSDKVYSNPENGVPLNEGSTLGGSDPYSASKVALEFVARSYGDSYFAGRGIPVATARGGNVIGGGDFSSHRLVPDLYRAARSGQPVELRYPNADRPWQHVLDCVFGYLTYVEHLAEKKAKHLALNFGPAMSDTTMTVAQLAEQMGRRLGNRHLWKQAAGDFPPEKMSLRLDASLAYDVLGWQPRLDLAETIEWTAEWYSKYSDGIDAFDLIQAQIAKFLSRKASTRQI